MGTAAILFLCTGIFAAQEPPAAQAAGGEEDGIFLRSADGAEELRIGTLFQVNANLFESGLADRDTELLLRKMRLEFEGRIDRIFRFNFEPNFAEDEVELEEAWVGADLGDDTLLMLGRMKEPFSLEEMSPTKHHDFVNFSLLSQFVPKEDHGVTLFGSAFEERLAYGAAIYNGTGGDELNSDKDVAGRLVWKPFAGSDDEAVNGLQFGGSATYGVAEQAIGMHELKTEARVPFLSYLPGSMLDGRRVRLGAEAAWLSGPFGFNGEIIRVEEMAAGAGGRGNVVTTGWYAAATWVVTGEEKTFEGVWPARPVFRSEEQGASGTGALQLAFRASELRLGDALAGLGLVAPASHPGEVRSYDLGLNWYLTYHARMKLHFLHTRYGRDIPFGGDVRGSENAVLLQFQINF